MFALPSSFPFPIISTFFAVLQFVILFNLQIWCSFSSTGWILCGHIDGEWELVAWYFIALYTFWVQLGKCKLKHTCSVGVRSLRSSKVKDMCSCDLSEGGGKARVSSLCMCRAITSQSEKVSKLWGVDLEVVSVAWIFGCHVSRKLLANWRIHGKWNQSNGEVEWGEGASCLFVLQ